MTRVLEELDIFGKSSIAVLLTYFCEKYFNIAIFKKSNIPLIFFTEILRLNKVELSLFFLNTIFASRGLLREYLCFIVLFVKVMKRKGKHKIYFSFKVNVTGQKPFNVMLALVYPSVFLECLVLTF